MNPFNYVRAASPSAALAAAGAEVSARFLAGGTSILDLMKLGVECPPVLIDINALPWRAIERRDDVLKIGALMRLSEVAEHDDVRRHFPLVAKALEESASPQLRNMATIGGNLMQRTRCPYFRDRAAACNKRLPGSGCDALEGENRREAVLGTSASCIATHPSDLAVALTAVDAIVELTGRSGRRALSIGAFYRQPGKTPHVETSLEPDELIAGVSLTLRPSAAQSAYVKVRDRAQYDFALASAAVVVERNGGAISAVRIALGGVGTVPWRSTDAETALQHAPATRATFERKAEEALRNAHGYGQNDFKILRAALEHDAAILTIEQGCGSPTVYAQLASEILGIPFERVRLEFGNTRLPEAPLAAGSQTAGSVGSVVTVGAVRLRDRLSALQGRIPRGGIVLDVHDRPAADEKNYATQAFGAHFAEVHVDPDLGEVRVVRFVAAFDGGRILNAKTARSQFLGGIVWGISMALFERTAYDRRTGRLVNASLGDYLVPTNADVPNPGNYHRGGGRSSCQSRRR